MPNGGEYDVSISPGGQWAAFTSLESGTREARVRRFPSVGESMIAAPWASGDWSGRALRIDADYGSCETISSARLVTPVGTVRIETRGDGLNSVS
jgi:hypothetical protein